MSIQRKFGILLGLICLSVVVSLGASAWAVTMFQRELSDPFAATASVLEKLDDIKSALERADELLDEPTSAEALGAVAENIRIGAADLTSDDQYIRRVGVGASRTLSERLSKVADMLRTTGADPAAEEALARAAIHGDIALIDRITNRALADAQLAVTHGEQIRNQLFLVLALSFLLAIMNCALGVILIRRWILRPIDQLRRAATRIGAGDYSHRIVVSGHDELARLSAEVNDMAGLIAEMQKDQVEKERLAAAGEVIRRLAHNIRNPLAGIRGLAEIARAELPPDSEVLLTQNRIIATVDKFEKWLAELLNSTSPLRLEHVRQDVAPWLAGIIDAHRAMAETRGVKLAFDAKAAPTGAIFDPRHLEQAVVAILSNAIEMTPREGVVAVASDVLDDGKWWRIRVTDQGPGVPDEFREKVFAANFTTKPDGHGIGLAVAQQVVRGHHGRIFVDTAERAEGADRTASGASFVVLLPVEPPRVEPSANSGEHLNGVISGENSHHRG